MKKLFTLLLLCFALHNSNAQVFYYKVEWTMKDKTDLFTGICKITVDPQNEVKGEIVWQCWAVDSSDQLMVDQYKGKKGKIGIEFIEGNYFYITHDMVFTGTSKEDPDEVIGTDKYTLKLSVNKQVLYGTTATEGTHEGMFYGAKLNNIDGEKQFLLLSKQVKRGTPL